MSLNSIGLKTMIIGESLDEAIDQLMSLLDNKVIVSFKTYPDKAIAITTQGEKFSTITLGKISKGYRFHHCYISKKTLMNDKYPYPEALFELIVPCIEVFKENRENGTGYLNQIYMY